MTSKKKLKQRIAVLEERLVGANNYNEAILKEANAHRDVIEDIVKAIVTNFFDDGYLDATIKEVRAAKEWENAREEKQCAVGAINIWSEEEREKVRQRLASKPDCAEPNICSRCEKTTPRHEWLCVSQLCKSCHDDYLNTWMMEEGLEHTCRKCNKDFTVDKYSRMSLACPKCS